MLLYPVSVHYSHSEKKKPCANRAKLVNNFDFIQYLHVFGVWCIYGHKLTFSVMSHNPVMCNLRTENDIAFENNIPKIVLEQYPNI